MCRGCTVWNGHDPGGFDKLRIKFRSRDRISAVVLESWYSLTKQRNHRKISQRCFTKKRVTKTIFLIISLRSDHFEVDPLDTFRFGVSGVSMAMPLVQPPWKKTIANQGDCWVGWEPRCQGAKMAMLSQCWECWVLEYRMILWNIPISYRGEVAKLEACSVISPLFFWI